MNQFITARKGDKVPTRYDTGARCDPHDPANWTDFATAKAYADQRGELVGFVLTEADQFFCVDLDKCAKPDGSAWEPWALAIVSRFPGALVEVSQSGKGLHIWGRANIPGPHRTRSKNMPGVEVYSRERYVAITSDPFIIPETDLTAPFNALVAEIAAGDDGGGAADWTDGPREDWDGYADDRELLAAMFRSRSAGAAFGDRASACDLFHANDLGRFFPDPDPGREFDHSAADAALMSHLAFWTGCDCERMDRLFRMSRLMRDKYEGREDYRRRTITGAAGRCQKVHQRRGNLAPARMVQDTPGVSAIDVPEGTARIGYQFLSIDQQRDHFADCVYVRDIHKILVSDGGLLKPEQFKAWRGGYEFSMTADNSKTTKNAFEAFVENRGINFPKVHSIAFRPDLPAGKPFEEEGLSFVNTYVDIPIRAFPGDVAPFLEHMAKLFPDENDRAIMLYYMAACVQHKGVKFQWAPLIQGAEGNGKTFLIRCVEHAVGTRYTHLPNAQELGGGGSKFNGWLQGKLFIGVEEIYVSDRREVSDALKPLITNSRIELQAKGQDQITFDNRANFILCSNHKDAIQKTLNDRRYAVFYTAQQNRNDFFTSGMVGDYFTRLWDWARADGFAHVADYLMTVEIPDALNPARALHRAPTTSSTDEAVASSRGPVEQEIIEAIEGDAPGFRGGWISSLALDRLLEARRFKVSRHKRKEILEDLGFTKHPALAGGRLGTMVAQELGRPVLWVVPGSPAANSNDPAGDYCKAQGYA